MSAQADRNELPPAKRRRLLGLGLLRALATTVVLVALYYLVPLDHIKNVPLTLVAGLLILLAVTDWQVRTITRARHPASSASSGRPGAAGRSASPRSARSSSRGPTARRRERRDPAVLQRDAVPHAARVHAVDDLPAGQPLLAVPVDRGRLAASRRTHSRRNCSAGVNPSSCAYRMHWPCSGSQPTSRPISTSSSWVPAATHEHSTLVASGNIAPGRRFSTPPTFQTGAARPPRCKMISAESTASTPSRRGASRALKGGHDQVMAAMRRTGSSRSNCRTWDIWNEGRRRESRPPCLPR
jgi:hypothetical protein